MACCGVLLAVLRWAMGRGWVYHSAAGGRDGGETRRRAAARVVRQLGASQYPLLLACV